MRTMSEFIMEQEIETAEVSSDVELMESFMQMNAVGAIAECYCEHAFISEFATAEGLNVFSESDENIIKRAWDSTKAFFEKVWEWLKAMVKTFINLFTKSKIDRVIAKLEARKDKSEKITVSGKAEDPSQLITCIDKFGEFVAKACEGGDIKAELETWTKGCEELVKAHKDNRATFDHADKYGEHDITIQQAIDWLKKQNEAGIPSTGSKLLKKFGFEQKKVKNGGESKDKDAIKKIKKAAGTLAKVYDKQYDWNVKFISKALGEKVREEKVKALNTASDYAEKAKKAGDAGEDAFNDKWKQDSYEENTDGYFFL